ncbi:hypothetical protein KBC86_01535, partial [Candidatus Gracilibacteria bacterium]|nr:hypothetical protein [Candidatus Gracilibacteria bacterium]
VDTMLRTGIMNRETTPAILSIGGENIKIQSFTTDNPEKESLRKQILATNDRILPSLQSIQNGERDPDIEEIQNMGKSLKTEVSTGLESWARDVKKNDEIHTLAYADSSSKLLSINDDISSASVNSLSSSVASSTQQPTAMVADNASSYKYEGIYILDKNNKQVRLFDYTDGVDGKEELVYIDVDKDGDDDIMYRMDNSLYFKENFLKDPTFNHSSLSPQVKSWQDFLHIDNETSRLLAAPNHFEETFVTSGEVDFSFRPANFSLDNLFRFEYYDYIDRFDRINSGETPRDIRPETPIHQVDLIPELLSETVVDTTQTGFVGRQNIVSFGRGSGKATVTMNAYQAITTETNGTTPIIISEGRTVYTDAQGAIISYQRDGESEIKTLTFAKHTNYEFLKNTKIWMKSGTLYLFRESQEQKTINISDLFGMPIPAKTKVEIADSKSYLGFNYYDKSSSRLDGPGTYEYYPLGKKSAEYNVSLSIPNEWYYARLFSMDKNIKSTIASLHLLSPQKEADAEGPLINYGDVIRVPVYQTQILNLKPYIEDISGVDNVWVDMDLTKDTNGDGDVTNDKDSLDPSTAFGAKKGSTIYHLNIGPFDTLFTKKVRLFAEDGVGNVSSKDLVFTVYPPIPEIRSLTGTKISGDLSEVLKDEPVDIFRLRNNILTRIPSTSLDTAKTSANGTFSFMTNATKGIVLTQSGRTIANIDERTGKIELEDNTSFHIAVIPATSQGGPMQIQVQDSSNKPVFSEKINISPTSNIEGVSDLSVVTGTGIFVKTNDGLGFVKNALSNPNLALGGYITDADHKAIAGIAKSGDIYILDAKYKLSYTTKDSSILIRLQDSNGAAVADIWYKIDAEYIIK